MQTYEINGKHFPVIGYVDATEGGEVVGSIPIVDIPMMSDYKWQLGCLQGRLKHPEWYEPHENVPEAMERLKEWILEHTTQELYLKHKEKYMDCYEFIYGKEGVAV